MNITLQIELLNKAAQCIDDCLMLIYPEEFYPWQVDEAKTRFFENHGIIARTATMADELRKIAGELDKNK
jgi:hypothetical protein